MSDTIQSNLEELKERALAEIAKVRDSKSLRSLELKYLGRHGELTRVLRNIKDLSADLRPRIGQLANEVRDELKSALNRTEKSVAGQKSQRNIDVTLPGKKPVKGGLHPVTQMLNEIWRIFESMNFQVITRDPEIETDYFNFESLNIPPDHPARDMQDTFYIRGARRAREGRGGEGDLLLRTHTTASQLHFMKDHKPPFRVISTGKCYRRDSDVTHTPMFHQFDGFAVDRDITMADLKGTLKVIMSEILGKEVKVRFRISYFPFVEPGAEFDVSCTLCQGKGCSTCKHTGWLEMGGCGMIHPNVLREAGLNSDSGPARALSSKVHWQGYAFGFGVERPFMIRHKISDLRLFFDNDLRFLEQF